MDPKVHNTPNLQAALLGLHNRIAHRQQYVDKQQAELDALKAERRAIEDELNSRGVRPRTYVKR